MLESKWLGSICFCEKKESAKKSRILKLQLLNEKTISQLLLIPSQNLKSHLYFVSRCIIALQTYTYIPVLHVTFCIVDDEALINTIYPI